MSNMTINLNQADVMKITQILIDQDPQDALDFIRAVIEPQLKASHHTHCRAWTDQEEKPY
ncbi:MAG: hypothetical protein HZA78_06860 [Candidatus Schekmanbacteria bacterium]|nr:hypothetical protein [Candidatus Schekmanbacteria bacterium]